ncbi:MULTISPECIES: hypothetical protein [Methylobacterium]|uniref:hypothetical protein n=1 Tax=Methylobacterium TaxID=407 RepID=UPI0013EAD823|nr:hypothetical protein [Methylobacterium sp. DB0501]NGM37735.1 hypothetical protein [Methylobacterium sp. DB0501]
MSYAAEIIEQIEQDHRRIGRLLQAIDNGRWWSADEPGRANLETIRGAALQISESTMLIERLVGGIGTRFPRHQNALASSPAAMATPDP